MYQVTAIYQDCEVGYGEADSLQYAIEECVLSIDGFYRELEPEDFTMIMLNSNGTRVEVNAGLSSVFRGFWLDVTGESVSDESRSYGPRY